MIDLLVDATSFRGATFIDVADKQPITARPNAMLTLLRGSMVWLHSYK